MDADYIKVQGQKAYDKLYVNENLGHKRYNGGHALTEERFEDIIKWIEQFVSKI